jgi:outer membrane protein
MSIRKLILIACCSPLMTFAQGPWDLEKCIEHALSNNLSIKQSELNLELTELNQDRNLGAFLPSLNASGSHGYNWGQTIDPFTNSFATERIQSNSFGISTGMTLFNGFQILNSYKQGSVNIERSKADLQKMKNDVALNVANAYLNVLFNQEFLNIARFNFESSEEQVKRIEQLVEVGAAPEGNLMEIKAQNASDKAAVVNAENNLNIAMLGLTQLLRLEGIEAKNFSIASPQDLEPEAGSLAGSAALAVENAVNTFPEIKSAQAGIIAAEQDLSISKGAISPRLSVSFSYGTGYSGANNIPVGELQYEGDQPIGLVQNTNEVVIAPVFGYDEFETKPFGDQLSDNINSSLFFQLTVPIFNGFNTKTNIAQNKVRQLQAEFTLEQVQQQLSQDVERAYADALAAYNNYLAAEASVEATNLAFEYATVQYEAGVINAVDYTNSRIRRDNAQADLIRNKYDYIFRTKVLDFYQGKALSFK